MYQRRMLKAKMKIRQITKTKLAKIVHDDAKDAVQMLVHAKKNKSYIEGDDDLSECGEPIGDDTDFVVEDFECDDFSSTTK